MYFFSEIQIVLIAISFIHQQIQCYWFLLLFINFRIWKKTLRLKAVQSINLPELYNANTKITSLGKKTHKYCEKHCKTSKQNHL